MKLIVGLGNPGIFYSASRHNIGFMVIKALAKECRIKLTRDKYARSFTGKGIIAGEEATLSLPLTFMNLSGGAVLSLVERLSLSPQELLVVCDDLDLEFGQMRIRASGSSGGHRGLQSIIEALGKNDFCRLRLGIGRPRRNTMSEADFVLNHFSRKEKAKLKTSVEEALSCCRVWISQGAGPAMNQFNQKKGIL